MSQPDDEQWINTQVDAILVTLARSEYTLTVHRHFGRPVKHVRSNTELLFQQVQQITQRLGYTIDWQDCGGCCDGNNLARTGLAVLDSLGVRGGKIHSPEEYIILDSLAERATLSALLLVALAQGGLEDLSL